LTSRRTDGNTASSSSSGQSKSNPFGSATAVDTASKLAKIDLREKEQKKEQAEEKVQETVAKDEEKPAVEEKKDAPEKSNAENNAEEANDATNNDEEPAQEKEGGENKDDENGGGEKKRERRERKMRQPKVVNSRAAMLGEAEAPKKEVSFHILSCCCLMVIFFNCICNFLISNSSIFRNLVNHVNVVIGVGEIVGIVTIWVHHRL
jgi:hypothetical protein